MTDQELIRKAAEALRNAATPQAAARAINRLCVAHAKANGMKPKIECSLSSPLQSAKRGGLPFWHVGYEAGPYDWAVEASMSSGAKVWAEPYYGFDLYFYAKEAK